MQFLSKEWIQNHDNKISFTVLYIGLSVFLSIFVSIFWLIPIVLTHGYMEIIKLEGSFATRAKEALWHIKLDIVLILFALWLTIYFEAIFGLLGLGAASRAAAQGGARFVAWQKAIKGALMTLDDAAQIAKGVIKAKSKNTTDQENDKAGVLDLIIIFFGLFFLFSTIFAPFIIGISYDQMILTLSEELKPW